MPKHRHFVFILLLKFMFPDKCFGFRLELVDEITEIVPSTFGAFIDHHQGLLACVKIVFFFVFKFLDLIQLYVYVIFAML